MERTEYTEKMKSLCRQQADLKIAHMDALEDHEAKTDKVVSEIKEKARLERREMKAAYLREQLELEFAKQTLRTDYLMEHPEENNRV